MKYKIKIAGAGGQGILTLGVLISTAAVNAGLEATMIASYGAEMRGGKANAQVIIADTKIASPFVEIPDISLYLNLPSYMAYFNENTEDSVVLYNSSLVKSENLVQTSSIEQIGIPLNDIALELDNSRGINIVMVGAFSAIFDFIPEKEYQDVIKKQFGSKGANIVEKNLNCFWQGYNYVKGVKDGNR